MSTQESVIEAYNHAHVRGFFDCRIDAVYQSSIVISITSLQGLFREVAMSPDSIAWQQPPIESAEVASRRMELGRELVSLADGIDLFLIEYPLTRADVHRRTGIPWTDQDQIQAWRMKWDDNLTAQYNAELRPMVVEVWERAAAFGFFNFRAASGYATKILPGLSPFAESLPLPHVAMQESGDHRQDPESGSRTTRTSSRTMTATIGTGGDRARRCDVVAPA